MGKAVSAIFTHEKSTKNTERFQEDTIQGQAYITGTIYVQRWVVGNAKKIKVTIEVLE